MSENGRIAEIVIRRLSVHMGPNTARMSMRTFAKNGLNMAPEHVRTGDVPKLLDAMRPMLSVLLGKDHCAAVIEEIRKECLA